MGFQYLFQEKSVDCLAGWLPGWLGVWLAGWLALVEFCGVFVWLFHFERVFTWLSDANLWFSRGAEKPCHPQAGAL